MNAFFGVCVCVGGGGGGVLMFKMLNMNECIFWCECVCFDGGGGGGGCQTFGLSVGDGRAT